MLAPDTVSLLGWVDLYWSTYPDHAELHGDAFESMLSLRAGSLQKEQLDILRHMFRNVQQVPDDSVVGVVKTLNELAYSGEVAALTRSYQDGAEIDFLAEMKRLQRQYGDSAAVEKARAWLLSKAGMMPSRRESSSKALRASASVALS
jgi:hypothetical protein